MYKEDLRGRKIGRLSPIEYLGYGLWKCSCECGNVKNVLTGDLNRGSTRSCGCLATEDRFEDLSGKKFNNLTVIEFCGR